MMSLTYDAHELRKANEKRLGLCGSSLRVN